MRLARCEKGHYYDKDKFTTCPHCNDMQIAPSETVAFEDPDAKKEQEVVVPETPKVEVEERVLFSAATPVDEENKEIEDKFESRSSSVTDDDSDDLDEMVTIRLSEQDAVVSAALAGGEEAAMSREDTMADKDIAEETKEEPIAEEASAIEDKPSWEKPQEEEPVVGEASTIEEKPSWEEIREEEPVVEEASTIEEKPSWEATQEEEPEAGETSLTEEKPSWEESKEEEPEAEEASTTEDKPSWEESKEEEPEAEEASTTEDKPSWEESKEEEPEVEEASTTEDKPSWEESKEKEPEVEETPATEEAPTWKETQVVEEEPTGEDTSASEEEMATEGSSEVEQSVAATAESKGETLADAVPGRIPDEAILQDMNSNPVIGWMIAIEGIHKGRSYNVKQGRNFVGRSTAMDICLSGNSKISRERHAIITYDPRSKKCYLQPDESRDLIYINDDLLFGPMAMKHNDVITMGEEQFVFLTLQCDKADWI